MGWGFGKKSKAPSARDALKQQHASGSGIVYDVTDISDAPAWADPDKKPPVTQREIDGAWGRVRDYKGPKNGM